MSPYVKPQSLEKQLIVMNAKYENLSDSLHLQFQRIDSLTNRLKNAEKERFNAKEFMSENFYSYSGALIETTSLLFTIFLATIALITFSRYKTLRKTINDKISEVAQNAKVVNEIKNDIISNQNYLKQAVEQYALLLRLICQRLSEKKTNRILSTKIFEVQSIINLYSPAHSDQFSAITNLFGQGSLDSLKHLENFVNNTEKDKDLILLALKAINEIKERED
jgi:hypothetical protein